MAKAQVLDVAGTLARLGLAAVWLTSGLLKAIDPDQTYVAVRAYDVLPDSGVEVVATVLPFLELALGLLLLVGVGTRAVAALSALLFVVFVAGVAQSWARGLSIDCGCFGGGGAVSAGDTAYVQEILRDIGFMLMAAWLIARPRTLFALDAWLEKTERT